MSSQRAQNKVYVRRVGKEYKLKIPTGIRHEYDISEGDMVLWIDAGEKGIEIRFVTAKDLLGRVKEG